MKKNKFWFYAFWAVVAFGLALPMAAMAEECLADYDRKDYPHWGPSDQFKDIRQEIIAGAVVSGLVVEGGRVVAGKWYDPFTGRNYDISQVKPDVDHLASLGWVHFRGGKCMTRDRRREIANDPLNLWAVHPSANRQKGANVSGWLPANLGICTQYLQRIKAVVEKYNLELNRGDVESYNLAVRKCEDWRNGIKIQNAKNWLQRWLE